MPEFLLQQLQTPASFYSIDVTDEGCLGFEDEINRMLIELSEDSVLNKTLTLLALSSSGKCCFLVCISCV
jgi:hypothetical protein